jgi:hypothetical protein
LNRYVRALSAIVPVVFFFFPVFSASVPRDANISGEAWWNFYTAGLPAATPTTVPADGLGVGHNVAQPDKVAAIGITLQADPGATVQRLALHLKEAAVPAANIGAETAVVSACPITGFWEPVLNGEWTDVPDYDCTLGKAAGKRSTDGTWSFDLLSFGTQWLDAEFPLEQRGILLLVEESTTPVQISFNAIRTGQFRLEFAATAPTETETPAPVVVGGLEAPVEIPSFAPPPAAPPAVDDAAPAVLVTQPAQNREFVAGPRGKLPWGVWLLVPIAIGGAAAVSYALGPGGRTSGVGGRREGAVSRVLSRRAAGG